MSRILSLTAILLLAATNLAGRRYYASATGASQIIPGAPRTLSFTATYRF